jgi:UDP-glucose 4-epimerase
LRYIDDTEVKMSVLLTGGAGFIGSHTAVALLDNGYDVVILDNFFNSKCSVIERIEKIAGRSVTLAECDLLDGEAASEVFASHPDVDTVIHFAGLKAVGESVEKPWAYYNNNLIGTLRLLEAMNAAGVSRLVFSSSATVYSPDNPVPYYEHYKLGATNPYGWTKVMIEQIIRDVCAVDRGLSASLLRYFNPIGAHESGLIGEDPQGIPNNLLPYVAKVAAGEMDEIRIFGDDYDTPDGTGVRDYIHVMDLARGHLLAMEYMQNRKGCYAFNLGTGNGTSVKEIIEAFEKACGKNLPQKVVSRRAGDMPVVYANTDLAAAELNFTAEYGIDKMCEDTWRWQQYCAGIAE